MRPQCGSGEIRFTLLQLGIIFVLLVAVANDRSETDSTVSLDGCATVASMVLGVAPEADGSFLTVLSPL